MADNKSYVAKMPEIPIRLVIKEGSKQENKANAEKSIRDALKFLKIDFFNLLYDEWDDALQAMDQIHNRIRFDSYLVFLMKKKNKNE